MTGLQGIPFFWTEVADKKDWIKYRIMNTENGLQLELHALTLVACSYALLVYNNAGVH